MENVYTVRTYTELISGARILALAEFNCSVENVLYTWHIHLFSPGCQNLALAEFGYSGENVYAVGTYTDLVSGARIWLWLNLSIHWKRVMQLARTLS